MLKHIAIHLEGPLCGCQKQNLAWSIRGKRPGCLYVWCQDCQAGKWFENKQIAASITCEQGYPDGVGENKPTPKREPPAPPRPIFSRSGIESAIAVSRKLAQN